MKNRINLDDSNYNHNQVTIQDNKAKLLWLVLEIIAVITAIIFICNINSGESGEDTLDPNRTAEPCSFLGTAPIFSYEHTTRIDCITDGDGYFYPTFGHHHHE